MLILNPEVARFEQWVWEDVAGASISRGATRRVEAWGDRGPHPELVDVPEIRTVVRLTRRVVGGDLVIPPLGTLGLLVVYTARGGSDAGRRKVEVRCVLTSVRSDVPGMRGERRPPGSPIAGAQTLTFVAVSETGGPDPVVVTEVGALE